MEALGANRHVRAGSRVRDVEGGATVGAGSHERTASGDGKDARKPLEDLAGSGIPELENVVLNQETAVDRARDGPPRWPGAARNGDSAIDGHFTHRTEQRRAWVVAVEHGEPNAARLSGWHEVPRVPE